MSKPTEPFSTYVRRRQNELGLTNDAIAFELGTTGPNFSKWKNENSFNRECIPALARVLRLNVKTPEEVEGQYLVTWRRPYDRPQASPDSTPFKRVLRQIDALHKKAGRNIQRLGKLTRELFKCTNEEHFLVSSTSGASLLILDEKDSAGREQRENRFIALDQGLLWALITPKADYWKQLKDRYTIHFTSPYHTLEEGFEKLRAGYVEHLRNNTQFVKVNPEEDADMRMQRLEWDDFPLIPLHWTVSLLGECPPNGEKVYRSIVRAPYLRTYSYQVFPRGNQPFEIALLGYFRSIVFDYYQRTRPTGKSRDSAIRRRHLFCAELLKRMEES